VKWNSSSIVGAVLMVFAVAIAFLAAPDDETIAFKLGYALGLPIFALAITALGRWVQRLVARGDDDEAPPFWTSGTVLALGIVAIVVAMLSISSRAEEREEEIAEFESSGEECLADQPLPVSTSPSGFSYAPLDKRDQQLFAAAAGEFGVAGDLFEGREIRRRGSVAGAVLLFPGVGASGYDDFLRGAAHGSESQGLRPNEIQVGNEDGILSVGRQLTQIAVRSGCYGVVVASPDRGTAHIVATGIVADQ
jgi:hypothetical protein